MGRRAAKTDGNHGAIVQALLSVGASVQSLAAVGNGCTDILCGFRGANYLLEVKDPSQVPSKRRLTAAQQKWHARWRGQKAVVETAEDALVAIGARRVLATVEANHG